LVEIGLDNAEHDKDCVQALSVLAEEVNGDGVAGVLCGEKAAVVLEHQIPGVEDDPSFADVPGHESVDATPQITRHDDDAALRILSDLERLAPEVENHASVRKATRYYCDQVLLLRNLRLGLAPLLGFATAERKVR
jgi:hypothetical protein